MNYALTTPVTIGGALGIPESTVSNLQLVSIFLDFGPYLTGSGQATLMVILRDTVSGYNVNINYQADPTALVFWNSIEASLELAVMNKLIADGKLPAGSLIPNPVVATPVTTTAS
jgi:hypothetical protein